MKKIEFPQDFLLLTCGGKLFNESQIKEFAQVYVEECRRIVYEQSLKEGSQEQMWIDIKARINQILKELE